MSKKITKLDTLTILAAEDLLTLVDFDDIADSPKKMTIENFFKTVPTDMTVYGSVTINEDGADKDFRIESVGNSNMLFMDALNSRIGVGVIPTYKFTIEQSNAVDPTDGLSIQNTISIGPTVQDFGHLWVSAVNVFSIQSGDEVTHRTLALNPLGGNVGIGLAAPLAKLHIDQAVDDAAIPVLALDQADVSEGFLNFIGSDRGVIAGVTNSVGSVRVEIGGVVGRLAVYADA